MGAKWDAIVIGENLPLHVKCLEAVDGRDCSIARLRNA